MRDALAGRNTSTRRSASLATRPRCSLPPTIGHAGVTTTSLTISASSEICTAGFTTKRCGFANHGYTALEIAEELELPEEPSQGHTTGYYGHLVHNVKAVYQRYLSWYDGNPATFGAYLRPRWALAMSPLPAGTMQWWPLRRNRLMRAIIGGWWRCSTTSSLLSPTMPRASAPS